MTSSTMAAVPAPRFRRSRRSGVRVSVIGAILAAGVVFAPLLAGVPAAHAADGTSLKIAYQGDIDTLNPFTAILDSAINIVNLEFESLTAPSASDRSKLVAGIASKWKTSKDAKTWTYTIADGRTWSDGEALTSADVVWSYREIMTDKKMQQANGGLVSGIKSVKAPDAHTVVITLSDGSAMNPGGVPIVPKHVWSKQANPSKFAADSDVVGSGPFLITDYSKGQSVQLKANPKFWRGKAAVDSVTYVAYKNTDAAVLALKNGEVDIAPVGTAAQFGSLSSSKDITKVNVPGSGYSSLDINPGAIDSEGKPLGNGNPALKELTLRKAIVMAVDNKTLLKKVMGGLGTVGSAEWPPAYPQYYIEHPDPEYTFDPAAANKLLDEAGYTKGSNGIRIDPTSGKPLDLRLMGYSTSSTSGQLATYIKSWLKDIGLNITVSLESNNQVNIDSTLGSYDIYFNGWTIGADPDFELSMNTCGSRPNADGSGNTSEHNWCSPEFDKLYKQQHTELDPDKRAEIVKKAQQVLYTAAVADIQFYGNVTEGYRSDRYSGVTTKDSNGKQTIASGYWSVYNIKPTGSVADTSTALPVAVIIAIVVAVLIIIALIVFFVARRRRSSAEGRE